ncbi:MAG: heparinase II/III domain-containing protein [Planctomycetota bacterium]|jgi:hypothetical protein
MRRGILSERAELSALRNRLGRGVYDAIHERLKRRCSLILDTNPVTEAQWRSLWERGSQAAGVLAARTTQGRLLDLIIAHHIEPNAAYHDRAIEELKNLVSWMSWTDPSHKNLPADLCTAEAGVAAVVGLDWLWEDLADADRDAVRDALYTKVIEPYRQAVRHQVHWYNTCGNWNAVINSGCGLVGLALSDESDEARQVHDYALKGLERFFAALGKEGGWDEGTGYWGFALRYLLLFGEAMSRLADDQSILHQRGMDVTGLFPIYFTPNGQPASFGDNPTVPLYGTFYLLSRHFSLKEMTWWLDTYCFHRDVSTSGFSAAGLAMLFRPVDAESPQTPDLEPLKVYREIGWAALADRWPRPKMYVAAKAGDLAASHSQHDMNAVQLQVDGEMILCNLAHASLGMRYSPEATEAADEVRARRHNTIVVGERDHQIDVQGSIVEADSTDDYRYLAMDSAGACGENVQFIRHVVLIVDPQTQTGETLVVLDELDNAVPERVEVLWHTLGAIDIDEGTFAGTIRGRKGDLRFALGATVKPELTTTKHAINSHRTDSVLRLSCGVIGKAYFAGVFTHRQTKTTVDLSVQRDGVTVSFGELSLDFRSAKRHMHLEGVHRG